MPYRNLVTECRRGYRARDPQGYRMERAAQNARGRALARLAKLHPAEYEDLCNEEREREGLPPLYTTPIDPRRES